jgi:hypothetical protein
MNRLSPELEKLITWARRAPQVPPAAAPMGFAARVAANWGAPSPLNLFAIWQKAIWGSAWAAAAVIVLGIALLTAQKLEANSTYDVTPAFQVVSTELVP